MVPYETHEDSLYVYKKSGNVADHLTTVNIFQFSHYFMV